MRRPIAPTALLLLAGLLATTPPDQAGAVRAAPLGTRAAEGLHPMPCPEGVFPGELGVECGFIRVPQDRGRPKGRMIRVAAAVIPSQSPTPAAEPILLLPGGPSAGSITDFSHPAYFADTTWDDEHDVVLVDTRGVGLSRPRLGCPELDRASVRQFYAGPWIGSQAPRIMSNALARCRARLVKDGVDPRDYTIRESVADLEHLRRALGVTRWNLMAVSADGILGLSYLRAHPRSIRAMILESGMTPQMEGTLDYERGRARELKAIFSGCRADTSCRQAYPGVGRAFMRLTRRLNERPALVTFPKFRPHPVRLRLDGAGLMIDTVSQIWPGDRFFPEEIHRVLDFVWRVTHDRLVFSYRRMFGRGPVLNDHFEDFSATGTTMSYECHAIHSFITRRDQSRAARDVPPYAPRFLGRHFDLGDNIANPRSPAGCRVWKVGRAPAWQHDPVRSSVPALVLAGGYDGGVPRFVTRQAVDGLRRSTYVEFASSGHLQLASFNVASDCARSIAGAFLRHPRREPDTDCVADVPELDFAPPPEGQGAGVERFSAFGRWGPGPRRDEQVGRPAALGVRRDVPR